MSTPVQTETEIVTPARRRPAVAVWAAAAALVVAAGATAVGLSMRGDSKPAGTTLALNLPAAGPHLGTCIRFDVETLHGMGTAFSGTASDVTPASVTLTVDHWYAGGDADTVTLSRAEGATDPELAGVAFEKGQRYFITATDGTVNGCGYSGPATPDLEQAFTQAFGG